MVIIVTGRPPVVLSVKRQPRFVLPEPNNAPATTCRPATLKAHHGYLITAVQPAVIRQLKHAIPLQFQTQHLPLHLHGRHHPLHRLADRLRLQPHPARVSALVSPTTILVKNHMAK